MTLDPVQSVDADTAICEPGEQRRDTLALVTRLDLREPLPERPVGRRSGSD
jgi:hypothetical protein